MTAINNAGEQAGLSCRQHKSDTVQLEHIRTLEYFPETESCPYGFVFNLFSYKELYAGRHSQIVDSGFFSPEISAISKRGFIFPENLIRFGHFLNFVLTILSVSHC